MTHNTARKQPRVSGLSPLLTYDTCAAYLGVSNAALRKRVSRGQVPADCIVKLGKRIRFDVRAIRAWINSMTGGAK